MKVFFTGSPRALTKSKQEHETIFDAIKKLGHKHMSDMVVSADPDKFYQLDHKEVIRHYRDSIKCIKEADIIVVEVSVHSMSMGYVVEKALGQNKPVIVLHLPKYPPTFLSGIEDDKLQILEYTKKTAFKVVRDALEYAAEQQDVRFNFFISPVIQRYLAWTSRHRRIPRAVYLRNLVEKDMKGNKEWKKQK